MTKAKLSTINNWWARFLSLSREDKLHYAKILRETDPRFNEIADVIDRWVEEQGQ